MNKIYKTIWSWTRRAFVVSDECHRSHAKSAHSIKSAIVAALGGGALFLAPAGAMSEVLAVGNGQTQSITTDQSYEAIYVSGTGEMSVASGATLTLTGADQRALEVYYDGKVQAQGKVIASVSRIQQARTLMLIGGNVSLSEVEARATSQGDNAIGMDAQNGDVSVSDSITVVATADTGSTGYAHGLAFTSVGNHTVALNHATVTAISKGSSEATGVFIQAEDSDRMTFTGATTLKADAQGTGEAEAVYALGGNLTFSGAVALSATSANSGAYGIKASQTNSQRPYVYFGNESEITVTGKVASYGINADQTTIQADKKMTVVAKTLGDNQYANAVLLKDSTLKANGAVAVQVGADGTANGLYLDRGSTLIVKGGLNVKAKSTSGDSYGIHAAEGGINYEVSGPSVVLDISGANTSVGINNGSYGALAATEKITVKTSSSSVANAIRSLGWVTVNEEKKGHSLTLDAATISLEASVTPAANPSDGRAAAIDSSSTIRQTITAIGTTTGNTINLTAKATGNAFAYGIDAISGTVELGNSNSSISIQATADTRQAVGIRVRDEGVVIINGKAEVVARCNGTDNNGIGLFVANSGELTLNSDITASATGGVDPTAKALRVQDSGVVNFNGGSALMKDPVRVVDQGKLNINSGVWSMESFRIEDSGSVTVAQGATLETLTGQVFTVALDEAGTNQGDNLAAKYSSSNLNIRAGAKLALNDAKYNSIYATKAGRLYSGVTFVFNGDRVDSVDGVVDVSALVDDENIVESNVQASVSGVPGERTVTVDKSFGVSSIKVDNSTADNLTINSSITLVGSADGGELFEFSSEGEKSVTVSSGQTLNLGQEGSAANKGKVSTKIEVANDATLKVNTGEFEVDSVSLKDGGTLEVADGNLTLGTLGLSGTNNSIDLFGDVSIKEIVADIVASTEALFRIGQSDSADTAKNKKGVLNLANAVIRGLTFFLDPVYQEGNTISDASGMAITDGSDIGSTIIVGQNSWLGVNATSDEVKSAQETFSNSKGGAAWGTVTAFAHFAGNTTITGKVLLDSSLASATEATAAAAALSSGSLTVNEGVLSIASGAKVSGSGKLTMADGTYLYVPGIKNGDSIEKVAQFSEYAIEDINVVVNAIQKGSYDSANDVFSVTTDPTAVFGIKTPNTVAEALASGSGEGAQTIRQIVDDAGMDAGKMAEELNKVAEFAYAGAAQSIAVTTATMVDESVLEHALGRGTAENSSSMLWVVANGNFSKADRYGFGSAGYRSDIGGVTLGIDGEVSGGFRAGVAFSAGTGKVHGRKTASGIKNSVDYYGLSLYGALATDYVDLVGSVGWLTAKNEISGRGMKAKPDSNTFTVGLHAQRSFDLTPTFSVTPHVGVRYVRSDLDSFNAGGFHYKSDAADIVQFPVGVALGAKTETTSGYKVKGFVDLSVVPSVGDKKSDMRFSLAGGSASDSVEGKIASTALYRADFGVNVQGGAHTLGASYGIGAGNGGRLDQTLKLNYRYAF